MSSDKKTCPVVLIASIHEVVPPKKKKGTSDENDILDLEGLSFLVFHRPRWSNFAM